MINYKNICSIDRQNCGRIAGVPVCPKCGFDSLIPITDPVELKLAQDAAKIKYDAPKKVNRKLFFAAIAAFMLVGLGGLLWKFDHDRRLAAPTVKLAAIEASVLPVMVNIPADKFQIGTTAAERDLLVKEYGIKDTKLQNETDVRDNDLRAFAIGKTEITRDQFELFIKETGYSITKGCGRFIYEKVEFVNDETLDWKSPGFDQTGNHPVVCVSWDDAQAFISWLNTIFSLSGQPNQYRLPSEAEWEYAARGKGPRTIFPWGRDPKFTNMCKFANGRDEIAVKRFGSMFEAAVCNDNHVYTAPVASYLPNSFGLHDMNGNVTEWVEDCYEDNHNKGQPTEGQAHRGLGSSCDERVIRGGSWFGPRDVLRSASRLSSEPKAREETLGFRLARSIQ